MDGLPTLCSLPLGDLSSSCAVGGYKDWCDSMLLMVLVMGSHCSFTCTYIGLFQEMKWEGHPLVGLSWGWMLVLSLYDKDFGVGGMWYAHR